VTFRDQFSKQAALYSQCRPGYPAELFDYLASIAPGHSVAWDCATGSGQAAVPLARFFRLREIVPPPFELRLRWTLPELTGYFRTWSATARYVDERGADPVVEVELSLAKQWGNAMTRHLVTWPVYIRAGYSD